MIRFRQILRINLVKNHIENWQLYKAQHESFKDDQEYYYQFCKNHKTLEIFAGFGRLTNVLAIRGIDIEIVEIEENFARFINIDSSKKHIVDILKFNSKNQFDRIIAGYNSFCLLTKTRDIQKFFSLINDLLTPGGYASLNYFHTDYWKDAPIGEIVVDSQKIYFKSSFDLSKAKEGYGIWYDEYEFEKSDQSEKLKCTYPVRIYENVEDLIPLYNHTNLELVDLVENFGLDKEMISEPGWIDYVFKKKS